MVGNEELGLDGLLSWKGGCCGFLIVVKSKRTREIIERNLRQQIRGYVHLRCSIGLTFCKAYSIFIACMSPVSPTPDCTGAQEVLDSASWPLSEILEDARLDLLKLLCQLGPDCLLHSLILE